ncbi:NlpC/P60 family protein [Actinacidiphila sp. DG2A-62]|uniref:C40 family peptidase n=1 Tax=Actinacidiphila sp. DG2A-62 TaxID=3108821 RepID=UPI002DB81ABE|nr:NlpC/P60 family protein [Actinacidiphila sp. DG2A-62]MEC3996520.1 NlpC/P60 family protein [Actinacidiphila sp. DG2A-62]
MASHSRLPLPRITVSRSVQRTAFTLALASAASAPFLAGAAQAEPKMTRAEVQAKVAELYQEAEQATQSYDGTKVRADQAAAELDRLQDELARKTARLESVRDALGGVAAAQYRSGTLDPTLQLALSSSPRDYLERAGLLRQLGARQAAAVDRLTVQQRDVTRTRGQASDKLAALRAAQSQLAARKRAVQDKLDQARALLDRLTPADRAAVRAADDGASSRSGTSPGTSPAAASRAAGRLPLTGVPGSSGSGAPAPSSRAAAAVAFAYRALGLPYVWGATGPSAYDCSGLTQAAWRAAGVALPRTTYTQINAGTRVPRSQLRPGDLVFFYSGISHVGLYIGDGKMIHAPHPGAAVRIAPISEMPFAAATRPA